MTIPEKVQASGLDYDALVAEYQNVYGQIMIHDEGNSQTAHLNAGNHILFLSEGWDGNELFTLPELLDDLKTQTEEVI